MAREWMFAPLFILCSRGCCDHGIIAEYLSIPRKTVRSLLWALRQAGFLRRKDNSLIPDCGRILWIKIVVRAGKRLLLYGDGRTVIVYIRRKGLRGYSIPRHILCSVYKMLKERSVTAAVCRRRKQCMRMLASEMGVHTKTVSLALRALEMLECPGPNCLADCE
jgi:hypothetical protein